MKRTVPQRKLNFAFRQSKLPFDKQQPTEPHNGLQWTAPMSLYQDKKWTYMQANCSRWRQHLFQFVSATLQQEHPTAVLLCILSNEPVNFHGVHLELLLFHFLWVRLLSVRFVSQITELLNQTLQVWCLKNLLVNDQIKTNDSFCMNHGIDAALWLFV